MLVVAPVEILGGEFMALGGYLIAVHVVKRFRPLMVWDNDAGARRNKLHERDDFVKSLAQLTTSNRCTTILIVCSLALCSTGEGSKN
jgi:hypothetical protein